MTKLLTPGEEAMVRLHPLVPDLWPPVVPGLLLSMFDGVPLIGQADVVEVVPPAP